MTASTVSPGTGGHHYGTTRDVVRYVSRDLGLRPGTVEQLMRGRDRLDYRFAALIRGCVETGNQPLLARLMAPVEAALERLPPGIFSAELIARTQQADLAEDQAEAAYHADPSEETRRRWLLRLYQQRAQTLELIAALEGV